MRKGDCSLWQKVSLCKKGNLRLDGKKPPICRIFCTFRKGKYSLRANPFRKQDREPPLFKNVHLNLVSAAVRTASIS